ncbi:type I secretion system protein LssZ [Legionella israelensis]|uniref:type I secretion system protein LssZ n=1 Tax=Legionella israelensis TaxID=454 RepID=UPI00117C77CE|nr:type I secretion system protein LssZ [Legionella israelensis]QDP72545.1 type I secretion system protein LssZ [Legionella israelensis]
MYLLAKIIHILFPVIAAFFLLYGIKQRKNTAVSTALWISLIALLLHYEISGGELLGNYFNYMNAAIYSINIIIVLSALVFLLSQIKIEGNIWRSLNHLLKAVFIIGCLLLITNVWINAYFIENRMPGTPVMQVANLNNTINSHCKHHHIFYTVTKDGSIRYLCPNKYGLLPGIGTLHLLPEFIAHQLPPAILKNILDKQQNKARSP